MIKPPTEFYQGTTYNALSRELQRYGSRPDDITPLELMEWAIDVGQWSLTENMDDCRSSWRGPYGNPPIIGSELGTFRDRNVAIQHMRGHYAVWWGQKILIEKAIELLGKQGSPCADCGGEHPEDNNNPFQLPF